MASRGSRGSATRGSATRGSLGKSSLEVTSSPRPRGADRGLGDPVGLAGAAGSPRPRAVTMDSDSNQERTLQAPSPRRKTLTAVSETAAAEHQSQGRQRKMLKRFSMGDVVEVYSAKRQKWFLDGQVIDTVNETCMMDGSKVRAGSVKVIYDHGMTFKWVPLQQMEETLRPSPRPRPPTAVSGMLTKEASSWLTGRAQQLYAEANQGFLQWWESQADAEECKGPEQSMYLLGLQASIVGQTLKLKTASDQVTLMLADEAEAKAWEKALTVHAIYTNEVRKFYEKKMAGRSNSMSIDTDLQTAIVKKELVSVAERRQAKERFARKGTVISVSTQSEAMMNDRLSIRGRTQSNVSNDVLLRKASKSSRGSVMSNRSAPEDDGSGLVGARLSFGGTPFGPGPRAAAADDARQGGS